MALTTLPAALIVAHADTEYRDLAEVAALDTACQLAVERNDWAAMDRILHPEFTLVLGNSTVYSRTHTINVREKGPILAFLEWGQTESQSPHD
jgi:hypothetical protein